MKLATFTAPGESALRCGTVDGTDVHAFGGPDGVLEWLRDGAGGAPTPTGESWPLDAVTLAAPIPRPGTIYAVGKNYADHIAEMKSERPRKPLIFVKVTGSVAPPGGPVRRPEVVSELDYEGELTLVIGAGGQVAGYCVADDVSARDLQRSETQWTRAKGADTFCPFGPWITTADEIADAGSLQIRTWVNGELRQDSSTSRLLFGIDEIVSFLSQTNTLQAGDLVLTGTPDGVGAGMDPPWFLGSGDVVRVAVEGLGFIEHAVA